MNDYVQIGEEALTYIFDDELTHFGIKGQKWGVRRYQNKDGSLTPAGKKRLAKDLKKEHDAGKPERITDPLSNSYRQQLRSAIKKNVTDDDLDRLRKAQDRYYDSFEVSEKAEKELNKLAKKIGMEVYEKELQANPDIAENPRIARKVKEYAIAETGYDEARKRRPDLDKDVDATETAWDEWRKEEDRVIDKVMGKYAKTVLRKNTITGATVTIGSTIKPELYEMILERMSHSAINDSNYYRNLGEEAVAYIFDDELTHHGTKGMKWGIRRYQNKDGSLTPEGRQRYSNDADKYERKASKTTDAKRKAKYEQRAKDARKKLEDDDVIKTKRAEEVKAKFEEDKKKALASGTAEEILKYKGHMTADEMQGAINRLQKEQTLASLVPSQPKVAAGKHFMDRVGDYTDYAIKGIKAWNTIANIYNGLNVNAVRLPKIEVDNTKSNRDLVRKDKKEKRQADAKKAAEAAVDKEIEDNIKAAEKANKKKQKKAEKQREKDINDLHDEIERERERQDNQERANQARSNTVDSDYTEVHKTDDGFEWTETYVDDVPESTTQTGLTYAERLLLEYSGDD